MRKVFEVDKLREIKLVVTQPLLVIGQRAINVFEATKHSTFSEQSVREVTVLEASGSDK